MSQHIREASGLTHVRVPVDDAVFLDTELWEANILSTTNWLDAHDDAGFPEFGAAGLWDSTLFSSGLQAQHIKPASHGTSPNSTTIIQLTSTPGQTSDAVTETGEYYVDGEPTRLPRTKRRKVSSTQSLLLPEPEHWAGFSLRWRMAPGVQLQQSVCMSVESHQWLADQYKRLCLQPPAPWAAFEPFEFPSKVLLDHSLSLYFKTFDQALPFVHPSEVLRIGSQPLLAFALSSIGFQFGDQVGNLAQFSKSLHEAMRRMLVTQRETVDNDSVVHSLSFARAELLNLIGLAFCDDERLRNYAVNDRRAVLAQIMKVARRESLADDNGGSLQEEWQAWCEREGALRLAHSSWLLDCMWSYQYQSQPRLRLIGGDIQLPSSEKLWQAQSSREWFDLGGLGSQPSPPSLQDAMQQLYVDKRLPRDRGEFARVLMIHALFHRAWEVERYVADPLSAWEPTAKRQSSAEVLPKAPVWPPSVPHFVKWQNSACDALDVLHWQALATIGQASSVEHSTVLQLHLARIVLLAPYEEILDLARNLTAPTSPAGAASIQANRELIQRWAFQHQYKARLAAIHSGSVFWHTRRYSIDAFYEAPIVALAGLTLWAFGTAHASSDEGPHSQNGQRAPNDGCLDDDEEAIILLDRPIDDELVQQFIRRGNRMRAHLGGADLYSEKGPHRILMQACSLLCSLKCWGVSHSWQELLQKLANVTSASS